MPRPATSPSKSRTALAAVLVCLASTADAAAQRPSPAVLPGVRYFHDLRADLLEPRSGTGLVLTNLLAARGPERPPFTLTDSAGAAREVHGTAAFGVTLPLLHLGIRDDGGVVLVGQAGISARFRLQRPSRDDLGQDWFVAIPVESRRGRWSWRVRLSHRSSHLGDEFMEESGATRIEFGGEAIDGHVARDLDALRAYLGASWVFRSYTVREAFMAELGRRDRLLLQAGADGEWDPWPDSPAGVVGGLDIQAAERTGWRRQVAAAAGLRWSGQRHAVLLLARVYDGPSFMGEFFLTPERSFALEFVAEF